MFELFLNFFIQLNLVDNTFRLFRIRLFISVSVSDPDWIRIQLGQRTQFGNTDSDPDRPKLAALKSMKGLFSDFI